MLRLTLALVLFWLWKGIDHASAQAPVADFTATDTTECQPFPLVTGFVNQSLGINNTYEWFFGDPGNSTSSFENPFFTYSSPGCYDVTLVATNPFGSDTLTKTCFIEVFPQPIPGISLDISNGCAPLTVQVTDTSQANASAITNWTYIWSDGSNSNDQSPTFTFLTPDTLTLLLTIINSNGCQATAPFPDLIYVHEPSTIDFVVDTNSACDPPLVVTYTNLTQVNGAINPVFTWDFPGGELPAGGSTFVGPIPPPVAYNNDGSFDASLTMTTDNRCDTAISVNGIVGIGGVDAAFTVSSQTVCAGEPITFQATSTGGVTTHQWDFGEVAGIDATGNSATYAYSQPGVYPVTLFANNADCGDTLTLDTFITVQASPTASFIIDRNFDCQPNLPFAFTDLSTFAVAWDWSFGDGNSSNSPTPTHSYADYGSYEVCLIVTNIEGCQDTICDSILIQRPNIDFSASPREGCVDLFVSFQDISNNPGDPVVQWEWILPGALPPTSTTAAPSAFYNSEGEYDVGLIITTNSGCTDTLFRNNFIRAGTLPVNGFSVDKDTVCVLEDITFTADSINPDWEYFWDFQYVPPGNFIQQAGDVPTVYPDTGVFSVALIINNTGCRDTLIVPDLVYVSPPQASFQVSDDLLCGLPATISFTDESTGPADVIEWYVNSTLYSTAATPPDLTISTPNSYVIRQVLTNTLTGCSDTAEVIVNAGNPQASFTTPLLRDCRPFEVPFINNSTDYANSEWNFDVGFSGLDEPIFTFQDTGFYDVSLIVTDIFGCRDTASQADYIEVIGSYARFEASQLQGCPGQVIQFTDTSTSFNTNLTGWSWNFGDPPSGLANTSSQQNPTHSFSAAGGYDITLAVVDDEGCRDTLVKPNYIGITFPEPDFQVADTSTCAGNLILFENMSQGFGLSYSWDFGDSNTDTTISPTHAYADTGFYDVTLVATDQNGCVNTLIRPNAIYIEPFIGGFVGTPRTGLCPPLSSQFQDTTIGNVIAWEWDFGVSLGGNSTLQDPGFVYLEAGFFDVLMVAIHEDGCRDTVDKPNYINVGGPRATYFVEPDEICLGDSTCLTAYVESSVRIIIDFQDGSVFQDTVLNNFQDTLTFCYLYETADTLSPTVIVVDSSGCAILYDNQDTVLIHSNPDAVILPQDTVGCSPFDIPFVDATILGDTAIVDWLWTFGDGDSSTLANPLHVYEGDTTYTVSLVVIDGYGCTDSSQTTILAQDGAIPDFVAADTTGCAPFLAQFTDLTSNVAPNFWQWTFGDGDTLTGFQNPDHLYFNDGIYTVTLIVGDSLGCRDTIVKPDYIVLDHPDAQVYADQTVVCNPATVTFFGDSSSGIFPLAEYNWTLIGEGDTIRQSTLVPNDSISFEFFDAGGYTMTLTVIDSQGCDGTSAPYPVDIVERLTPDPLRLRNVSVRGKQEAEVIWERYPGGDFQAYAVYRIAAGAPQLITTIFDQDALRYVDFDPGLDFEARSYCYKVLVQNTCDEFSLLELTEEHCTIELRASSIINAVRLDWSAYVGYNVSEYEVYRVATYDTASAVRIAVVPGTTFSFLDEDTFCEDSIRYRVRGIGTGGTVERSWSDLAAEAPQNLPPDEQSDVITATVVADSFVQVSWTEYPGYKPANYILERRENAGNSWRAVDTTGLIDLSYDDVNVAVDEQSYQYRVIVLDSCGDLTVPGLIGQTILLQAELAAGSETPVLNWSPYQEWLSGVLTYQVEVFNEATASWEDVVLTSRNERTFVDDITTLPQVQYCYRILATEAGGRGATSLSNEDCVIFSPRMFVPNVFTPNRDGTNDRFRIVAPNVSNGRVWIYNRWGQLIYEADNLEEGWDGTYQGRAAQEGVYVYRVEAVGFEGTPLTQSGTVTLVR